MGRITPILFHNDSYKMLEKEPEQVIENIKRAMDYNKAATFSIKYFNRYPKWMFWKKINLKVLE